MPKKKKEHVNRLKTVRNRSSLKNVHQDGAKKKKTLWWIYITRGLRKNTFETPRINLNCKFHVVFIDYYDYLFVFFFVKLLPRNYKLTIRQKYTVLAQCLYQFISYPVLSFAINRSAVDWPQSIDTDRSQSNIIY